MPAHVRGFPTASIHRNLNPPYSRGFGRGNAFRSTFPSLTLGPVQITNCKSIDVDVSLKYEHAWDVSPAEAAEIQERFATEVVEGPLLRSVETVAGVDVSIRDDVAQAAVAVLRISDCEVVDEAIHRSEVAFPYVPGLLSFREMPALLPALRKLSTTPDVFMTDSHGYAHPRRFGLACHLGLLLDWPAIGVAKSILTGNVQGALDSDKGAHRPLVDEGEVVGRVLRTRTNVNTVYVSIGHRCTLDDATRLTLQCSPKYKIPEPTRQAHKLSRT